MTERDVTRDGNVDPQVDEDRRARRGGDVTPPVDERAGAGGDAWFIGEAELRALAGELLAAGTEVLAPVARDDCASPAALAAAACKRPGATAVSVAYRALADPAELDLSGAQPSLSLKSAFLPAQETLFCWRRHGARTEIAAAAATFAPRVVLAAKPCDSAALAVVDKVMGWDYHDELWEGRRAATTILNLACRGLDTSCFCTAVGSAPDDSRGADGLLTPVEGGFLVEATTDKGRAFVAAHAQRFAAVAEAPGGAEARGREAARYRAAAREKVAANLRIDAAAVRDWIDTHFDDPLLAALGLRCNGCGACAGVCPACHCFDIVDEEEGVDRGARRRCWDTCQSPVFTLHASGHNPRADQHARFRQRIDHKFSIYPLRFGEVLCTGCGRCARVCHAGQDLVEILSAIDAEATS